MSLVDLDRGTKHELILQVMARGFTYRKARSIVGSVFNAIIRALQRGESIEIEGFGTWRVVGSAPRAWRFGKVIKQRTRRIAFRSVMTLPVGNDSKSSKSEQERPQDPLSDYISVLRSFMLNEMYAEDYRQFWVLRWHSPCYLSPFLAAGEIFDLRFPIEKAQEAIELTKPDSIPLRSNRSIEFASWYGRWTALLDVDRALWTDAERIVSSQF